MSKVIIALAILAFFSTTSAVIISEESLPTLWGAWKIAHNKHYSPSEESHRFIVFQNNVIKIAKLNAENPDTQFAINKFADLTSSEFKKKYTNGLIKPRASPNKESHTESINLARPDYVDWRSKGAVTPVKDQGQCGSCWAFSATGSLEGVYAIRKGSLISFSEQELNDCSWDYGNEGCNGGLMDQAFDYIKDKGIAKESAYPYTAQDGDCKSNIQRITKVSGYTDVPANDEDQLLAAIAEHPVSVAIEADSLVFQFYSSGIITSASCGTDLDHGVLAVGYDTTAKTPYYIVKNSWGASWGDNGYVKIQAQPGKKSAGICGIAEMASYPTL